MSFLGQVVLWVVPLGVVIFVHELGHFVAAKRRGVKVLRFSLGFGPRLWGWRSGDTEYRLAWIPFGGYVQMAGDSPAEDGMPQGRDQFLGHPWPGRILIAIAGPAANFVVAFLSLLVVGLWGVRIPDRPSRLGPVPDTSATHAAGFRTGDHVIAVNDREVTSWYRMGTVVDDLGPKAELRFEVERQGARHTVVVPPESRAHVFASFTPPPVESRVAEVRPGTPAYTAGLKNGDLIVAVDGHPVHSFSELPALIGGKAGVKIVLSVLRNGQVFSVPVVAISQSGDPKAKDAMIGIVAPVDQYYVERYGLLRSLSLAWSSALGMTARSFESMWLLVRRPADYYRHLGGPMLIAQVLADDARRGIDNFLQTFAFINIAIMSFNLLPIPILDGGHITLALLEATRRRSLSMRGYLRFQKVGLAVIGALLILILVNDPLREIQRQISIKRGPQQEQVAPRPR